MAKTLQKWHQKELLEAMYNEQHLTMRQIAEILGTTASTIKYWMDRLGITSRDFCIGDVNKGKHRSKEEKDHLSEFAKERFVHPENHPMFGRRHSEESRRKMSETKRRKRLERQGAKLCSDG